MPIEDEEELMAEWRRERAVVVARADLCGSTPASSVSR
jgi:hypothetical protein